MKVVDYVLCFSKLEMSFSKGIENATDAIIDYLDHDFWLYNESLY